LAQSVEQLARVTQGAPDVELERAWAWGAYDSEGIRFASFRTYEELRELATKMASERAARGPALSLTQRILAQYHAAYRDMQAALLGTAPDELEQAPAEGEWPLRQIVAHIVGADVGFYGVIRYALERHRTGDGRPAKIPDEAWDALIGKDEASFQAILDGPFADLQTYHGEFHERALREFADVSEKELDLPSMYWEDQAMSLRFRLHRFDSHMRQHTVQIDKTCEGIGRRANEAKRLLRLIYAALASVEGATIGAWELSADPRRDLAATIAARADEIAGILAS
jgi:uncharacterized damage-inducible protein DinB